MLGEPSAEIKKVGGFFCVELEKNVAVLASYILRGKKNGPVLPEMGHRFSGAEKTVAPQYVKLSGRWTEVGVKNNLKIKLDLFGI